MTTAILEFNTVRTNKDGEELKVQKQGGNYIVSMTLLTKFKHFSYIVHINSTAVIGLLGKARF